MPIDDTNWLNELFQTHTQILDEGTTMNYDNTITPMFIGMQYHVHQNFKEKLSIEFCRANNGRILETLMASCGLAYYCYEDDRAQDSLRFRAADHHSSWVQFERARDDRIRRLREDMKAHMVLATKAQQEHSDWRDFYRWLSATCSDKSYARGVIQILNAERSTHAATIASAMHDGDNWDTDSLIAALKWIRFNADTTKSDVIFEKLEAQSSSTADIVKCADCGTFVSVDDASEISDGDQICDDCLPNYCESSDDGLIPGDLAYQVFSSVRSFRNGSVYDWCLRDTGMDNYYWYESGRCFFTDEEDRDSMEEDRDSMEEARDSDDGLNGYHSSGRSVFFEEQAVDKTHPCLGVELEVYCNDSRWQTVKNLRKTYPKDRLIMERDGSLDEDSGFEIVTRPMGRTEWSDFGPELLKKLRANDVVGFNAPTDTGTYGIHVNLHRRWLSPLAEARIMMFLCAQENKSFVRAIAQRDEIYDPSINIGQLMKYEQTVSRIGGKESRSFNSTNGRIKYAPKIYGVGKYAPVNWKDNIAEFRIFQSTLNTGSFMKNLEFIWALVEWTKPAAATGTTWMYQDFVKWLNTPANRKEYPYLIKYLSKKSFPLGGENEADGVESEWADLMVKPDTEAHFEGASA